jgi:hypothetical protein
VRVLEERCPFCDAPLERAEATARIVPGTTRRLGRAAVFVFGASVAAAACESEVTVSDAGEDASGPSGTGPAAAGPSGQTTGAVGSTSGGGQAGMGGSEESTGSVALLYGAPAVGGAGGEGGTGGASSSSSDVGGNYDLYGVPPPPD